jgi:hypothetical protein
MIRRITLQLLSLHMQVVHIHVIPWNQRRHLQQSPLRPAEWNKVPTRRIRKV